MLKFRIFAHSWISDWNHGNAHFLRGLAHELGRLGHNVRCYEQVNAWSVQNLLEEDGERSAAAICGFFRAFSGLDVRSYKNDESFASYAEEELRHADVVILHEWNDPTVVRTILSLKHKLGFRILFHDTHHRAYTSPREIAALQIGQFDGVLAFGEALRHIYLEAFHAQRCWTFHEAADTAHFRQMDLQRDADVVWIGNWGDEERTRELQEFLIGPAAALPQQKFVVHGVRYPTRARVQLAEAGIEYRGYLSNLDAPQAYARSAVSIHVPRRFYQNGLSGIPTIRVFEALACGSPLVCSTWNDNEGLFRAGHDYLLVPDGRAMREEIQRLLNDESARKQLAANGLQTIRERHTCFHRATQLLDICEELGR